MNADLLVVVFNTMWDQPLDFGGQALPPGCEVSTDPARVAEADALVFHTPSLHDRPLPAKRPGQLWVAWSMECEVHYPTPSRAEPGPFDLFMTYHDHADVRAPYLDPSMLAPMRRAAGVKTAAHPVACFISADIDRSGRTTYLRELMRHIDVDCYGRVLRNVTLPRDLGRETKLEVIARYKFTLAFENARAPDYVTEKLYDPLVAGSVPVYLGAPNVEDFAPGDDCLVRVDDFASPRELAAHLRALDADDDAYARYHAWRRAPLRPAFMARLDAQRTNPWVRLCALLLARKRGGAGQREATRP